MLLSQTLKHCQVFRLEKLTSNPVTILSFNLLIICGQTAFFCTHQEVFITAINNRNDFRANKCLSCCELCSD